MEFTSDDQVRAIRPLTDALFKHVLHDEEPLFFGDEATILDLSMAPAQELQQRCAAYYKVAISLDDLRRPLWQLLPELERQRQASPD